MDTWAVVIWRSFDRRFFFGGNNQPGDVSTASPTTPLSNRAPNPRGRIDGFTFFSCPPPQVQPYLSLAIHLVLTANHRVRIATHDEFGPFVLEHAEDLRRRQGRVGGAGGRGARGGLEFYPIGGDPRELMAYMVKSECFLGAGRVGVRVAPPG
jgi:hypothetical protein